MRDPDNKRYPVGSGVLEYFPRAIEEVAYQSWVGAQKHCGGVMGWDRSKSPDDFDAMMRHSIKRGTFELVTLPSGELVKVRSSAAAAWRALAVLEKEIEDDCQEV